MKLKYQKPKIKTEDIEQKDILCSSNPEGIENRYVQSDSLLSFVFNGGWIQED